MIHDKARQTLTTLLLNSLTVPESCRELKVESADSETVTLNWQPPETDAGITKYKVMPHFTTN